MKNILLLLGCLMVWQLYGQSYDPVSGKIMTVWGEKVTPENAWREYPRPQLKREAWQNLNGLWEYSIQSADMPKPATFDGKILVPFAVESALSGVGKSVMPDQKIWYQTRFTMPGNWSGQQIMLHFQAVDWETSVWINGKLAGTHKGGSTMFSLDITRLLRRGEQELLVSVWDPTDTDSQARGKQVLNPGGIWYTPVSGIWQTVWLEPVNPVNIVSVNPVTDIDRASVTLHTDLKGIRNTDELSVIVRKDNRTILEATYQASAPVTFQVPSPKLWTPETPELYDLEISLARDGRILDKVTSYFAMRKISMITDAFGFQQIQLNNETLFQYGTLDQGWWPDGLLTPPSAAAMRYDMEVLKDMGFNMLRKHIKIEPFLYYYYADSLGLLLWQDMPSGFETAKRAEQHVAFNAAEDWARPGQSAMQFEYELKTMIDQLRFFPSIVTWVVFNEGWGQYETKRIVEWTMDYDKTRLINGVSGWTDRGVGHMYDAHQYPGPGMVPAEKHPGMVIVLGEFGGLGLPVEGHLWDPGMRNWGYRTYTSAPVLIKEYIKLIHNLYPLKYKGLAAAVYTQTTDVEGEVNGLLTYDRKAIKIDSDLLRILHAPLYAPVSRAARNLVKDSETTPQEIKIAGKYPGAGWHLKIPEGEFQILKAPVAVSQGESIWSASSFNLQEIPNGIVLKIRSATTVKVFLNGHLVLDKRTVGRRHYEEINLTEFRRFLKKGENILAVEAPEYESDGSFDYGLYTF